MQNLWHSILSEAELSVSHATFLTWFKTTEFVSEEDDKLTIAVPNIFSKRQFDGKLGQKVNEILEKKNLKHITVEYIIKSSGKKRVTSSREITDNDTISTETKKIIQKPVKKAQGIDLNPRYTFENFIVGSSNDLAYTACQAVVENPGTKYNPLFLYGGSGLGKTHLIQAVGNQIAKEKPKLNILYTTSEAFFQEFIDSVRFKIKGFSEKYRSADVLIIDDMQFIAGKEKSQEEFFHTFNTLHQNNKQIIISSDRPPKEIPTLTDRLRSRFEWGMAIDIQMPDFETRSAIIEAKAEMSGVKLKAETIEYLATNIKTNIRELEGALNQLLAISEMRGVEPDALMAEGILGDTHTPKVRHISPKQIVEKTGKYFQVSPKDIVSPDRSKHIAQARQIAMYLIRTELKLSYPKIASELGRSDHTTAMHSVLKIEKSIKIDYLLREQVSEIREKLYA